MRQKLGANHRRQARDADGANFPGRGTQTPPPTLTRTDAAPEAASAAILISLRDASMSSLYFSASQMQQKFADIFNLP
ncbi:hypothetical protein [Rhodanobacter aciditrophus]|uniref:hypothetical protein n=1 Tax=Rhodanobacter aciditrophus TaxID=1623218 RepID=UPI003CF0A29A